MLWKNLSKYTNASKNLFAIMQIVILKIWKQVKYPAIGDGIKHIGDNKQLQMT